MTDKEIVVGGIDVSGCKCLRNVKIILELARPEDFELLCGATNGAMKCEQWKDCYYKQLQRKTKECEKKSWEIGNLGYKIKNQRREINERLKQIEKLKRKEQECEELKSQIETYSKMIDNSEFKIALTDVRSGEREVWRKLGNKAQKYEQALDEIEKECKRIIEDEYTIYQATGICYEILDIINKAKDINVLTKKENICQ